MSDDYKDVPNLDGLFVEEVEAYYDSITDKEGEVWELIRQYAYWKSRAMRERLAGDANAALRYERTCDIIYQRIKDHVDW